MLQCRECEFYGENPDGSPNLRCDPLGNIKEPECLLKWQLIKLEIIMKSHEATLRMHERLAPLQEKMISHMEREINEAEEADSWKLADDDEDEDDEDDDVFPL